MMARVRYKKNWKAKSYLAPLYITLEERVMSFAAFQPSDLHFAESESGVKKWVVDARNFD